MVSKSRFDKTLGAAKAQQGKPAKPSPDTQDETRSAFWDSLKADEPVPTVRLSVSVPLELDNKIKAKADELRVSKNELINKMLEYLLE